MYYLQPNALQFDIKIIILNKKKNAAQPYNYTRKRNYASSALKKRLDFVNNIKSLCDVRLGPQHCTISYYIHLMVAMMCITSQCQNTNTFRIALNVLLLICRIHIYERNKA